MASLKKSDFTLNKVDHGDVYYLDYWFDVHGESKEILEQRNWEYGMIGISQCVYSYMDGKYGVLRIFMSHCDAVTPNDEELEAILKELVSEFTEDFE